MKIIFREFKTQEDSDTQPQVYEVDTLEELLEKFTLQENEVFTYGEPNYLMISSKEQKETIILGFVNNINLSEHLPKYDSVCSNANKENEEENIMNYKFDDVEVAPIDTKETYDKVKEYLVIGDIMQNNTLTKEEENRLNKKIKALNSKNTKLLDDFPSLVNFKQSVGLDDTTNEIENMYFKKKYSKLISDRELEAKIKKLTNFTEEEKDRLNEMLKFDVEKLSLNNLISIINEIMYKNMEDANELVNENLKDITNRLDILNDRIRDLKTKEKTLKSLQMGITQKIELDKFQNDFEKTLHDIAKKELANATDEEFRQILKEAIKATDKVIKEE